MPDPNEFAVPLDKATEMLKVVDGSVHTFRQTGPFVIGADWDLSQVLAVMEQYGVSEAGPMATGMGHALIVVDGTSPLFLATKGGDDA